MANGQILDEEEFANETITCDFYCVEAKDVAGKKVSANTSVTVKH